MDNQDTISLTLTKAEHEALTALLNGGVAVGALRRLGLYQLSETLEKTYIHEGEASANRKFLITDYKCRGLVVSVD